MAKKKENKRKGKTKAKVDTTEEQLSLDLHKRKGQLLLDVGNYRLRLWNIDGLIHEELVTDERVAAILTSGPDYDTVARQCERLMKSHRLGSLSGKQARKLRKWIDKQ